MSRSVEWVVLAACALAPACGGDDGDDGAQDPSSFDTQVPEQFCRGAASYECAAQFECVPEADRDYPTELACKQARESECEDVLQSDPLKSYSPSNAASCLEDMSTRGCLDVNEPWLDAACDDITVTGEGQFRFTWTSSQSSCTVDPAAKIGIEISGNGQNYTFQKTPCSMHQTVDGPKMPYGTYTVTILEYYSDGSGPSVDEAPAELDSPLTIIALP